MARFSEDSPDTIPLHVMGKEWAFVFVSDGAVYVEKVARNQYGTNIRGDAMRMTPEKAGLLIKALKRAIKEAKRSASEA